MLALYHLCQKLGKTDLSPDVKKNDSTATEFMQEVTISYLCEAFMAWAGLESLHSTPVNITVSTLHASLDNKVKFMIDTIGAFVDEYILPQFDVEKVLSLEED